ncbi:MAG: hypothetical protein ACR2IF_17845 [Terriglobales bacterium]
MTKPKGHWRVACVLLLAVCTATAADWTQPVGQLARDISAITGPGAVSLSIRNFSSLGGDQVPAIRRDLQNQLRTAGVRVVNANSAAAEVQVTLSENATGYLWVAEVRQAPDVKIAMVTAPRLQATVAPQSGSALAVRKTLLWSQTSPILDVATFTAGNDAFMAVLDPENVSLYKMSGGKWSLQQSLAIAHAQPWRRDMRGRLVPGHDHLFDAYLPGVICAVGQNSLACRQGDDPWPVANGETAMFGASRNFFTGIVTPGIGKLTSVPAFYSAATLPRANYVLWAFARIDGTVHLMDGVNDVALHSARDWGSDMAAVKSSCGAGTQLLVSGAGDGSNGDTVRVFEIADREPVPVAPQLEFAGPVTALWNSSDRRSAVAVAHSSKTGKYDAYELAIICAQ